MVTSCVKCEPKNIIIKGSKCSSSNFKSHLKRKHDSSVRDEYENCINDERKEFKNKHPNNTNCKNKTKYSQHQFDEDVNNYIIHAMVPLNTVENPFFKEMFTAPGILKNNGLKLMNHRSLSIKMYDRFNTSIGKFKTTLEKVKCLCTTADVWYTKIRSFMGVTVHWIDEDSIVYRK